MLKKVAKLDGSQEEFKPEKISSSIFMAAQNVGGTDKSLSVVLANQVLKLLKVKFTNGETVSTAEIGNLVEKVLIENGHARTAKAFIVYRENKKHLHQDKSSLGIKDDIGLPYNTLYILKQRYLKRNADGEIVETPAEMIDRVAKALARVEKGKEKVNEWYLKFKEMMTSFDFLPGSRTLANAGKISAQLANCFVWPIKDDINDIFAILHKSTLIKKHGGGCGYNFSGIRPEGDIVGGIPDLAAGPVKMIEMFNLMTSLFRQEGKYESGNMAILNANHPDIFNFISAKASDGYLSKTNISVGVTDEFMKAAVAGKSWNLINPRTAQIVNTVDAKSILDLMANMAWSTGDPGIINLSAMNRGTAQANPLLAKKGPITATNPCGEVPLYPYESCNLGYLNFANFVKGKRFDFERMARVIRVAVRLMDNVITASWFPVAEVRKAVREHRRIGIGAVGWAETLSRLDIPYDSPRAFALAKKVVGTMYTNAFDESCKLAKEKGSFPLVKDSIWAKTKRKPRNVALLTFPPSSSNAVICDTSFGIEPYFAVAYEQNVLEGVRLKTVIPLFVEKLKEKGIFSEDLIQKIIDNHGSVQGVKGVPKSLQRVFRVAHDISWRDHIKMQAAFQSATDNAITKTINMASTVTPKEIEEAYILAWKLGCKGLTVYRDRTKANQVFEFGGSQNYSQKKMKCPNCDIDLIKDGKCYKCERCGFSTCEL
ncbi:ribonucleoside-diphosphate reductase, adenosylcobalamin-dependent [Candidatus Woesebacteria bacterium RBG_19FT_COMBO_47_8]|uniref:Vitamin B12-dependent ribonucleotide reductase n=1 Tax=Candidatus Woesebacteria bacterium RBG_13_46_13 TaxID=1802479 RepID=A0A1F7X4T1_9BACT|nr:MAG: ribonucleoside-diphosphate reductase, adenosylcobalamin-dependent [Candidatus Woesebacteria bacterium RBG_13_46_13]OGM17984.1 MAG: ribonucleoside-diphosphate reductase, adenosylcobalamin-dependent [Candidatus Woesebacteria bacterium RBG_19FT_COMBO_47_8]HJX59268.1 adenosylcobalamin-dependent ribonucleoside-diphosphate reductase [Patescibacteria group bacterium]